MKKHIKILALVVLAIFTISCSLTDLVNKAKPTEEEPTERPTRTPRATKTPEPIFTEAPTEEPIDEPMMDLFLFDDFSSSDNYDWPLGYYPGNYADATYEIANGVYSWEVNSHDSANKRVWLSFDPFTDFDVSVDARQTTDNYSDCDYGLMFRQTDGSRLLSFTISNDEYDVYSYSEDEGWVEIVPYTYSEYIYPDGFNNLRVTAVDGYYTFYVNYVTVADFYDYSIYEGDLGLNVDIIPAAALNCNFEFDNYMLMVP